MTSATRRRAPSRTSTTACSASCCPRTRAPAAGRDEILAELRERGVTHGIATSAAARNRRALTRSVSRPTTVVVERGDVARAKPAPDLFIECARRLGVEPEDCYVIGDAVWGLLAARRARMLAIGLLSGG